MNGLLTESQALAAKESSLDAPIGAAAAKIAKRDTWTERLCETLFTGGGTLVLLPLLWLLRRSIGLDSADYAIGFATFYGAYVINDPHFAVTYLLFYTRAKERMFDAAVPRAQRIRHAIAGVVVPVALALWGIAALAFHSAQTLGWMIQLMFFLVGWHYVKQGFGVLTVLSARRGVRISPRERTVFLIHCFAGWAFAWANPAIPAGEFEEKGVVYRALAHPRWLEIVTGSVLALSALALAFVLFDRWRRERTFIPFAPLFGLLVTVWSWTIFSSLDPLLRYAIPALHSIQYFYFVWLMKRNEARAEEAAPTFGRPVGVRLALLAFSALALGWLLFRGIPTFLDGILVPRPGRGATYDDLGATPYFAVFFVFVNIHHYFMDYVIWRRENPDTRHLRDAL